MADEMSKDSNKSLEVGEKSDEKSDRSGIEPPGELVSFIREQYAKQKDERDDQIDEERSANFFARVMSESKRMSAEVEKSHRKLEKLHDELGAERITSWRTEHAGEVLLPHQAEAVSRVSYNT